MEWDVRIDNGQRKVCESPTGAAGQKLLVASCSRRPCLQNKPSNRRLVEQQAGRPCWSPRLTPFFCRSGAHSSQLTAGRQITGSLYASAKSHAGSCLSRAATLAPGTNGSGKVTTHVTMPTVKPNLAPAHFHHLEHQPSGEYPGC